MQRPLTGSRNLFLGGDWKVQVLTLKGWKARWSRPSAKQLATTRFEFKNNHIDSKFQLTSPMYMIHGYSVVFQKCVYCIPGIPQHTRSIVWSFLWDESSESWKNVAAIRSVWDRKYRIRPDWNLESLKDGLSHPLKVWRSTMQRENDQRHVSGNVQKGG